MGVKLNRKSFDEAVRELTKTYKVFAPVVIKNKGKCTGTDVIRYKEVEGTEEIVFDQKSLYSAKEVVYPVVQTLFYFKGDEYVLPEVEEKEMIVFLRPCDVAGIRRMDMLLLENGPHKDIYYEQLRKKVKFFVMSCGEKGFDTCFCVSMGCNTTEDYSVYVKAEEKEVLLDIKDEAFSSLFTEQGEEEIFTPDFVKENAISVTIPKGITVQTFDHPMWKEYSSRCIACGRCNMVCPSCTCFTMQDTVDEENPENGERRRVWAGCHIDNFTDMAGGHKFRKNHGDKMRYKTMHKIHDFAKRFGIHMCTGCGRCDEICPQYISFSTCINKLNDIMTQEGAANE